jgi:hypothetical protein
LSQLEIVCPRGTLAHFFLGGVDQPVTQENSQKIPYSHPPVSAATNSFAASLKENEHSALPTDRFEDEEALRLSVTSHGQSSTEEYHDRIIANHSQSVNDCSHIWSDKLWDLLCSR